MREHVIDLPDGRQLMVSEWGDEAGTPVVYCHGTPETRAAHLGQEAPQQEQIRLLVPDRPGYGYSDPHPRAEFGAWAADVSALADSLEIGRFAVLGYSGGGPHALACAAHLGERVSAVGLASSMGPTDDPLVAKTLADDWVLQAAQAGDDQLDALIAESADHTAAQASADPEELLDAMLLGRNRSDVALGRDPELRLRLVASNRALASSAAGIADDLRRLYRPWDFSPSQVSCPVEVWHGTEDRVVAPDVGRRLVEMLARARLHLAAEEGHLMVFARANAILRSIVDPRP